MEEARKRAFHGRRKGRPIRTGRQRLLEELLPRLNAGLTEDHIDPAALFEPPVRDVWLEIGFGGGEHLAEQARMHPGVGMIGCEPFINGVARLLSEIDRDGLDNIRIHADDARDMIDRLPDASIGRAFVLFADPWPKTRHNRRRFIGPENLDRLARVMKDGAELRLASDQMPLIRWMLLHTINHSDFEWTAKGPQDWRSRPADWPQTRYEAKAAAQGIDSAYLVFRRRPRAKA
ncbi:MAG: tRNA (guanine(46)-N(7))-methyltransferase TrmB [Alphaproteobacteria bacterium]|nr:tRNA (guanine(46)-N(7))-methyltransferase TrmB [Alphaproteobacteria bacterium]